MVQNHTLQLLSLLAMDKPATFTKDAIRAEKLKFWEQLHNPTDEELKKFFIRGQYHSRVRSKGKKDISYRSEPNVDPGVYYRDLYASGAFFVDSDRFRGVPFFFRTGKTLDTKRNHGQCGFQTNRLHLWT